MDPKLGDLGERRIVTEILPKYCLPAGNDCAAFAVDSRMLAITTDPVPEPAAKILGADADLYWMGWLLVTINMSDLAAAGARPAVFVAAIEAPATLLVSEFERFLLGIRDGCARHDVQYVGGNLREAPKLSATGTAVGTCNRQECLSRRGAALGDWVVSVGQGGVFWRDALALRAGATIEDKDSSPLFRPVAQVSTMRRLHEERIVSAAIDNSDGLLASAQQLAIANRAGIEINLESLRRGHPDPGFPMADVTRLWLGWGDWNVICVIPDAKLQRASHIAREAGGTLIPFGRITDGDPEVHLVGSKERLLAPRIESERFAKDSWFSVGIDAYIEILLSARIPE